MATWPGELSVHDLGELPLVDVQLGTHTFTGDQSCFPRRTDDPNHLVAIRKVGGRGDAFSIAGRHINLHNMQNCDGLQIALRT